MNTFTISVDSNFGQLLEEILVEDVGATIDDISEEPKRWTIIFSTDKTQKDLDEIISEYIAREDFIFC